MSEWTKEKLEKIYVDVQKKCATDKEFRDEILKDANSAIEKLTGETIPEGFKLKAVEQDPNYTTTFVIPDLISEELTEGDMQKMAGGISVLAGVSACALAIEVSVCDADVCGVDVGTGC